MKHHFQTPYTVTIGDINYGGHMGNERALVVFQESRIRLLKELGYTEKDVGDNVGIIMVESGVRYLREVFLHDELYVSITVRELKTKKFSFEYEVVRKPEDEPVLRGFTSFLTFEYGSRKVVPIPENFSASLAKFFKGP